MNGKRVILLGAGGHAKVCLDILHYKGYQILGFAAPERPDGGFSNLPYIGTDQDVLAYPSDELWLVNAVGSIGDCNLRKTLFQRFKQHGYHFPKLVHPSAVLSADVILGEGAQVMAGAIIQPGSFIGDNTVLNTKASIDHDCKIGKHVHVAPGVTVSGGVRIDDECHIGTGANIIQNIHIEEKSIVGAGALVNRSVKKKKTVVGIPAKEVD